MAKADDVAKREALSAGLRFSNRMKPVHNVVGVQSLADLVADAEYKSNGKRVIP